jgi:uncharacterized protein with PIN domain
MTASPAISVHGAPSIAGAAAAVVIVAALLLAGPRAAPAGAYIAEHVASARSPDTVAREATLSDEAEEEQEESAIEKAHEEVVTAASRHEGEVAVEHEQGAPVAAQSPAVTIERVRATASGLLVTIETSQAGTITFTGRGLKRTAERLPAKAHEVKVRFSRDAKAGNRHPLRIKLAVSLRPTARMVSSSKEIRL